MEITVNIAGKDTVFKKSGGTMRRFKSKFGREWFAELDKIARMQRRAAEAAKAEGYDITNSEPKKKGKNSKEGGAEISENDKMYALSAAIAEYDSDPFYDILYIMAKEANPDIPDTVEDWLDTFEDFPFIEVFAQVSPMLSREMSVDAKNG